MLLKSHHIPFTIPNIQNTNIINGFEQIYLTERLVKKWQSNYTSFSAEQPKHKYKMTITECGTKIRIVIITIKIA